MRSTQHYLKKKIHKCSKKKINFYVCSRGFLQFKSTLHVDSSNPVIHYRLESSILFASNLSTFLQENGNDNSNIHTEIIKLLCLSLKVARPSILIGTPSIFESFILKQIDLYGKTIKTKWIKFRLNFITVLFFGAIRKKKKMSRDNNVAMVLALNRISALFSIFF